MNNLKDFQNQNDLLRPFKIGDIVEGAIIQKTNSAVYLDLGPQGTGIIYGREFLSAKDFLKNKQLGDKIFVKVVDLENEKGYIELSLIQASKEIAWENLREKKEKGETIVVKISGANKGGLLAEISGISAFLPVSQLSSQNYPRVGGADKSKILNELQKFVGKEIEVKILDLDRNENKLILSEKALEFLKLKEIIKNYKVGDTVEGDVSGIVDFGVFIKFGVPPLEGLCHISELDWQIIEHPSQIVKVGEKVKAAIIEINDNRIFLSLKALKEDPWKNIEEKYHKRDVIEGKVIKFNPFGAFVEVAPKIQGLAHISEFGTKTKMEKELKIGEKYQFQISELNPEQHRMILKVNPVRE